MPAKKKCDCGCTKKGGGLCCGIKIGGEGIAAILISCMDYRFVNDKVEYFNALGYNEQYDHFVLAGASLGLTKPKWKRVAYEHIDAAIMLHKIKEIIILDHMDCGMYKLEKFPDEKKAHLRILRKIKRHLKKQYPTLTVITKLMDVDGSVKTIE